MRFAILTCLVFGCAAFGGAAQAQLAERGSRVSVFRYADPGQPTIDVRMWGSVRTPGIYQIETEQDLIGLITLAGGPVYAPEREDQVRDVTVRISRAAEGTRMVIYEAPLEELFGARTDYPDLEDDDIVTVDVSYQTQFGWRDATRILSSVGTITVIVLNIIRLSN